MCVFPRRFSSCTHECVVAVCVTSVLDVCIYSSFSYLILLVLFCVPLRGLLIVYTWPVTKYKFFVGIGMCIGLYKN
jgi:hypothetical protein